jgi:hypothetical protein
MPVHNALARITKRFPRTPYEQILLEGQQEGYVFRLHQGDELYEAAAECVEVGTTNIVLVGEEAQQDIKYNKLIDVQVLPKSRVVNLIVPPPQGLSSLLLWLAPMVVAFILLVLSTNVAERLDLAEDAIIGFAVALLLGAYSVLFLGPVISRKQQDRIRLQAVSGISPATRTVLHRLQSAKNEEEYFSRLIESNLKNIDDFNSLVKQQTRNSFRVTIILATAGFGVLILGIVMDYFGLNASTSAVTIASGVTIEFISAIFFYLFNRTIIQLNRYHKELIDVQNTMLALKISQGIVDDQPLRNQTIRYLTETLVGRLVDSAKGERPTTPKVSADKANSQTR